MNPHYHPYGGADLTPPHPPSPDNGAGPYHPAGAPPNQPHGALPMHPSNGHHQLAVAAHHMPPGGPVHEQQQQQPHHHHHHHQHPAFAAGGAPHFGPHHPHLHHLNNGGGGGGGGAPGAGGGGPGSGSVSGTVKVCAGCGGKILERFLLHALDRYWHNGCLKCSCCGAMLADIGSSCFTKGGMILCKNDYMRLFGNSGACSACGQTIPASEFVMRTGVGGAGPQQQQQQQSSPQQPTSQQSPAQHPAHVFHLKCFACSKCGAHLVPGDRYYMLAGSLVCEQDWHKLLKGSAAAGTTTVRKGKVGRPRRSRD